MENISEEDRETIREFLVESYENLSQLEQNLVALEQRPNDAALLGSIFRTFHTIKGACGFLAFSKLEKIAHQAENLLSQLRDGLRELTPELVSLILQTLDASRKVLASIENSGSEGDLQFEELIEGLRQAAQLNPVPPSDTAAHLDIPPEPPLPIANPPVEKAAPQPLGAGQSEKKEPPSERRKEERRQPSKSEEDDSTHSSTAADANIRVGVLLLDKLMDLVGELVLTRNQILQFNAEREDAALNATSQRLNLITSELQEGVMKTRMQTIGVVWNSLPRVVRDMAIALGKQIQLKMEGADTELDRTIIEAVKDPLIHLLRNSCDHGIELPDVRTAAGKPAQGTIALRAYHEGGQVTIEIGDDGAGIDLSRVKQKAIASGLLRPEQVEKLSDRELVNVIFLPGFSTVQAVTKISGRGVGMDVVKSHIEKIGGSVDIFNRPGEGTTVKIRIPLTLAIIPGLVISSGGERFVIPQVSLLELIHLDDDSTRRQIEYVHGTPVYRLRGRLLPVVSLNHVLKLESPNRLESANMVVLQADDRQFGLLVDGINDTQEIVVKPLRKQLKGLTLYAGATIMGDGRVALILDVLGIGQYSGVLGQAREQTRPIEQQSAEAEAEKHGFLLFKTGSFERVAIPLSLVARLEEFPRSAIERVGGGEVVQYRNHILPLVSLRSILEPGSSEPVKSQDLVQVVVFNFGKHSIGMVVDQILDIAEEAISVRQPSNRKGLLGSAVVGKLVTDFLDLTAVIDAARKQWGLETGGSVQNKCVLLAEPSTFSMSMVRSFLDMAGYAVLEAASMDEAIRCLEKCPVDIVLAAQDLQPGGTSSLLSVMRRHSHWKDIPVLAIAESIHDIGAFKSDALGFQDCQLKSDRTALLESMARLLSSAAKTAPEEMCAGAKR